ncbi:glutamate 5-kinase [Protomyces lactucae-debilis]|uniref:Glutamate 5-kinase n=1 Tax=Protomyces lactucae-debilis TaxID=2754530 RepID=A0A1Y2EU76_PROLT|nr:glutamate 5-kinase [Protomyces lactucae-debilis]ORY75089.1 glutamate 5-kinase [Protomyces lactucae-debilis]
MRKSTIVIKLGTSSICDEHSHEPLLANLSLLVETATRLRRNGHRVVIVSSGGIAMGLRRLDLPKRPKVLAAVQAIAAVGQCRLIALWDDLFRQLRQPVAQILLTRNDIADRSQYLNARNTLSELLDMDVIPIVNENDTLAVSEIKFGDNDTLSAITAALVSADYLFLMTDVDCLYTGNPRTHADAKPIQVVSDFSTLEADVSEAGSAVGTGGMFTKIIAAKLAASAGVTTIITRGSIPARIIEIVAGLERSGGSNEENSLPPHTRFLPSEQTTKDRHIWLLHGLHVEGRIVIDAGAHRAICRVNKAGLLPAGVLRVEGHFAAQQAVSLCTEQADGSLHEVARALSNYAASEVERIKGHQSSEVVGLLGYADTEYVCHRDNIAFL